MHGDLVLEVDQPRQGKGEVPPRHELHLEREPEDVRVGVGQHVAHGEAAQPLVAQQPVPVDLQPLESEHGVREPRAARPRAVTAACR